jgi:hypothetical protein
LIIECSSCHARYQYDEERFERKPSKKIKCAKCASVFEIHNPAFAEKKAAPAKGDRTSTKREKEETSETAMPTTAPTPEVRSNDRGPSGPQMPEGRRLSLAVIDGPDAGSVYRIEKPRVTIGRSGADLNLNDTEASRAHAAVVIRDQEWSLEDLQSTNGTLVDGQRILGPTELQNHSEFQIGSTTIMLIVTDDV